MGRRVSVPSCALSLAASLLGGASANAQDQDDAEFPNAATASEVTAWMRRNTDLDPASVVALTPTAVTAVLSTISTPEGPSIRQVNLRSESISRAGFEQDRVLSWTSVIEVDCNSRKTRQGRTMAYAARNLIGEGRQTVAASTNWVKPAPGAPAHGVMLRVCDAKFVNPLMAGGGSSAGARISVAPPPPRVAPAARPVEFAKAPPAAPDPPAQPPAETVRKAARVNGPTPRAASGRVTVQVAAAPSQRDAQRRLAAVEGRSAPPAGVSARVVRAVVGGKVYYRAQFTGFATRAEAQAFCQAAASDGCLVRGG